MVNQLHLLGGRRQLPIKAPSAVSSNKGVRQIYCSQHYNSRFSELIPRENECAIRRRLQDGAHLVRMGTSTLPGAGRGVFATRDVKRGTPLTFYDGTYFKSKNYDEHIDALLDVSTNYDIGLELEDLEVTARGRKGLVLDPGISGEFECPSVEKGLGQILNDAGSIPLVGSVSGTLEAYIQDVYNKANTAFAQVGTRSIVAVASEDIKAGEELFTTYTSRWWSRSYLDRERVLAQFMVHSVLWLAHDYSRQGDPRGDTLIRHLCQTLVGMHKDVEALGEESARVIAKEQQVLRLKGLVSPDRIDAMTATSGSLLLADAPPVYAIEQLGESWNLLDPSKRREGIQALGLLEDLVMLSDGEKEVLAAHVMEDASERGEGTGRYDHSANDYLRYDGWCCFLYHAIYGPGGREAYGFPNECLGEDERTTAVTKFYDYLGREACFSTLPRHYL